MNKRELGEILERKRTAQRIVRETLAELQDAEKLLEVTRGRYREAMAELEEADAALDDAVEGVTEPEGAE